MSITVKELAEIVQGKVIGDGDVAVCRLANLGTAKEDEVSFLSDKKMKQYLETTNAGVVLVKEQDLPENVNKTFIVVADPYVAFAKIANVLDTTPRSSNGIHSSAVVSPCAILGQNVSIGANAVIEDGAELGDNCQIGANCFIGRNAKIGKNTKLWANVSVYHECIIGDNCLFQSGAVIGSDGFGYANERGEWIKIPQLGRVVIGNRVEIGANTCIDRGALDDTIISDNVIIDNLVQVAHNDKIGYGTAIAGCTTIAGSVEIGKYCIIGGTSTFNGHIKVCDGVHVLGQVQSDITEPGEYQAYVPVQKTLQWKRNLSRILHLNEFYLKFKQLEKGVQNASESKE